MVGEFPELQGLIGGYYAAAQGEDPQVAAAICDHYKPVGQGDDVPTDPVTVAVSLADKLDTIAAFFAIDEKPTGSKDPFALRRAALGVIQIVLSNNLRFELRIPIILALGKFTGRQTGEKDSARFYEAVDALIGIQDLVSAPDLVRLEQEAREASQAKGWNTWFEVVAPARDAILSFFADRLKVQQREAGVRHDLIDAVFALGGEDDLVRLLARVRALQAFVGTADGANLLAGYKRAANILKKENWGGAPANVGAQGGEAPHGPGLRRAPEHDGLQNRLPYPPEPAETALIAALDAAEPAAATAVADEDFEAAMAALATLRMPIDAFFEGVIVNDPDPAKRAARLALLARVRAAVHSVADFSRIEG